MGSEEPSLPHRFTPILILPHQFVDLSKRLFFYYHWLENNKKNAPFLSSSKAEI